MSRTPPTCTDCHDADATHPDGWCDECAAMRDDDPNSPSPRPYKPAHELKSARARTWPPVVVRWPAPAPTEPLRYRFPF